MYEIMLECAILSARSERTVFMTIDIVEVLMQLLRTRSVSGNTDLAASLVREKLNGLGLDIRQTNKGSLIATVNGTSSESLMLIAHLDTLGAMVSSISEDGMLSFRMIGGYTMNSVEGEYCTIETYDDRHYSGTILFSETSVHAFGREKASVKRKSEDMYIRIDETVSSREDVEKLGISIGNFVHFDPRPVRTDSGFIKSRHLDDKAGVAILLGVASKLAGHEPPRTVYFVFTVHEEVGHGGAGFDPGDVTDMIVVDMGVAGKGRESSERKVTICAADSSGPFNYQLTKQLISMAEANGIPFAVDTFPFYNSDAAAALKSGLDARHALVGPGIDSSHAMERTHIEGIMATVDLIAGYIAGYVVE